MSISTYRIYGPWGVTRIDPTWTELNASDTWTTLSSKSGWMDFYTGGLTWAEVGASYTWAQLSDRFLWQDLTVGEIDAEEVSSIRIERKLSDVFGRHRIAKAHLVLDNHNGTFSPGVNSAMRPNRPISVHAELDTGSVHQLFTGTIESIQLDPRLGDRRILVEASDNAIKLRNVVQQIIRENSTVTSLYSDVAAGANIPRARMLIDTIADTPPVAYLDEQRASTAFDALKSAAASAMYPDGRGRLVVKDRNYDVNLAVTNSHDQFFSFQYALDVDRTVNVARMVDIGRRHTEISTVAWVDETIPINSGQTVMFNVRFVDPVTLDDDTPVNSIITPVQSADYVFTATQSEGAANVSSPLAVSVTGLALSAHVKIVNNGPQGFLEKFQIRGVPLSKISPVETVEVNSGSRESYDAREKMVESELYPNNLYTRTYAEWLVATYGDPQPEISWSLKNDGDNNVSYDLTDIITLTNTVAGVGSRHQIVGITHQITFAKKGIEHTTLYNSRASELKNYMILDDDPLGEIDSTRTLGF